MNADVQKGSYKSFQDLYDIKNNAFDIVRFTLAVMVIYSHSYPLFYGAVSSGDILTRISKHQIDFASLAVICFFIISGYLITQSLYASKNYFDYFIKRILRIFPALISSTLLFSIIIGPIITNLNFSDYFSNSNPNNVKSFIIDTITLYITGFSSTINDLFLYNPFPSAINGSAWTLKHEFACYIILALMSYLYIFRHKALLITSSLVVFVLVILTLAINLNLIQSNWWVFIETQSLIKFFYYFISGSLLYVFRDKIYYNHRFIFYFY